jgi:steroid delta-isomerase-like uncharacterized protein
MTPQEMKRLIEQYIEAYNSFDIDGMLALMHPDIVFRNFSGAALTVETSGIDGLRDLAEKSRQLFATRRQTPVTYEYSDDTSTVEIIFKAVPAVDFPGGPRAGSTMKIRGKSVFVFRDGRILSLSDYS